jgi:hypothetical protein
MHLNVAREVAALRKLSMRELRARYTDAFGETTHANNKAWLVKRIAWRLQANAEGDLSERARRRAEELARDADLRVRPPAEAVATPGPEERTTTRTIPYYADERLPLAGTVLTRRYKGEDLHVRVLDDGFEFEGQRYGSLSAVARALTGSHCNGYHFFRAALNGQGGEG